MPHPLLILDLDETLIHGVKEPLADTPDFRVGPYFIYKRPGVHPFLSLCQEHFELAVWTSASADYAEEVVTQLFPTLETLSFIWSSERCTMRFHHQLGTYVWIKNLTNVTRQGYALEQVLFVDDSPLVHMLNYGNLVPVQPFRGDPRDQELSLLGPYLLKLKQKENFRRIEKRFWRNDYRSETGA